VTFSPADARITAAIQKAAATWGGVYGVAVPTELVRAIIVRESGSGDPLTVDTLAKRTETVGAMKGHTSYGLMQVLDSTAAGLGLTGDPTALFIPEIGISYGVKYLASQLKRYGGDVPRAIAAYNAGSVFKRSDGSFVNQSYVDFVTEKMQEFGQLVAQAARTSGPTALVLVVLLLVLLAARKRMS
jgi:soluble lytic murein transglycosylase-like protein